jgi:hypothetical protein
VLPVPGHSNPNHQWNLWRMRSQVKIICHHSAALFQRLKALLYLMEGQLRDTGLGR